ncbi:hypothetical protein [Ferrimicrobium sp.]|uniref:hypothetical protein n=1 Tax=Ferrimicrobium sp. TaxID=2926050 RepID=UPI002639F477|nr:hypothetical protein [Ferrimicrobium sp.]
MTLRDLALEQLTDLHQGQVVEALAQMQGLPDDHPIWATVALLGTVIAKGGEGSETQVTLVATAQLNRQMPAFLARLEEVLGSMQNSLMVIEARLASLEAHSRTGYRDISNNNQSQPRANQ